MKKRGGMYLEREYEVIRLIQQNASCHIVTDCVKGTMLSEYIEEHEQIAKEQVFSYLHQMIKQLGYLQGVRLYRYVTPFCMIVKQNGELVLLNLSAKGNRYIINQLKRGEIRECFFKKGDRSNTVYSLGKTIQFILAKAKVAPKLTKYEEKRLKKIISKCLSDNIKQQYQKISEILFDFPQLKYKKVGRNKKIEWAVVGMLILLFGVVGVLWLDGVAEEKPQEVIEQEEIDFGEIGMTYFLEMEDYKKSMQMFEYMKEKREDGENYRELSAYMLGESLKTNEEMELILTEIEEEKATLSEKRMLFRVWAKMEGNHALKERIRLGECILEEHARWKEIDSNKKIESEIRTVLAEAYEKVGKKELALEQYQIVNEWNQTEEIYRAMVRNAQEIDIKEAVSLCEQGIASNPKSKDLRIQLIQMQCKDEEISKEYCEKSIKKMLEDCPELFNEEAFRKVQEECGIKVEGEDIWVEK